MKLKLALTLLLTFGIMAPAVASNFEIESASKQDALEMRITSLEMENKQLDKYVLQLGAACILTIGCIGLLWMKNYSLEHTIKKQKEILTNVAEMTFKLYVDNIVATTPLKKR